MKSEKLNQRTDRFTIVLNDSSADVFKDARNIVRTVSCIDSLCVVFIACIKHDKDLDKEIQQLKTIHYHLVLKLNSVVRISTIINLLVDAFHCNANQISIDKCSSLEMQTRYLTHFDDNDKYQYSRGDIVTNDIDYLDKCYKYIRIVKDMETLISVCKEYPSLIELMQVIGYDNYKKYRLVINDIRKELNVRY